MVSHRNSSNSTQLRVLVVGAGLMGALHARTVRALRQASLCGIVDRSEAVARAVGAELGVPAFTDLQRAIDETRPGAAIIATPDSAHREPARTAIEAGLAVLLEKPLATTIEDAESIIQLAKARGTRLMVGHIIRFDPRYNQAVEAIRSGAVGRPVFVAAAAWGYKSLGARVAHTTSPLWHFGIHHIDVIQWMSGGLVSAVDGAQRIDSPAGVSVFSATGSLSTGSAFQLTTGWTLPEGNAKPHHTSLQVHCEGGVLSIVWSRGGLTISDETRTRYLDDRGWPTVYGEVDGLLRRELEHFVNSVIDDTAFVLTPEEALHAVRSAVAIEQVSVRRSLT